MSKKIFGLILIDQITKLIFWGRDFFFGPIHIHAVKNFGLGFSLDFGLLNNIIILVTALFFFLYYYWQQKSNLDIWGEWSFILIFAGGISNIVDRVYLSFVRDFIDPGLGFTFNFADAFLVVGLLGILLLPKRNRDKIQL